MSNNEVDIQKYFDSKGTKYSLYQDKIFIKCFSGCTREGDGKILVINKVDGSYECDECGISGTFEELKEKLEEETKVENKPKKKRDVYSENNVMVHPSLDVITTEDGDKILVLGFRDKKYNMTKKKTVHFNVYLLVIYDHVSEELEFVHLSGADSYLYKGVNYVFDAESDLKTRILANINTKWSEELMLDVEENYSTVKPESLYLEIYGLMKTYLGLEKEEDYHLSASWAILTYFFIFFKAIPYLHVKGMKGSGKTTFLDLLRLICFLAFKERSTMPSFRDNVDSQRATALIDQADNKFGTNSEDDSLDMMTDSYKASSGIVSKTVSVKGNPVRSEYNVFSPKAFASIKELHFDLKDRCIQIQFIKSTSNRAQVDSDNPLWLQIRNKMFLLLISNFYKFESFVKEMDIKFETDTQIVGRNAELWKPIETIMRFCNQSEELIESVKNVYKNKILFTQDGISPLERKLLEFVDSTFKGEKRIWISNKDIVSSIILIDDDEWEEMRLRGKSSLVGNLINRMNLHSAKKHSNNGNMYLFEKEKVDKIIRAYITKDEDSDSPGFSVLKHIDISTSF